MTLGLLIGCSTSVNGPEDDSGGRSTFNIEYFNTMGLQNENPESYQKNEDVTLTGLSKVNYKFTGWYLNDSGSEITGWTAGTYKKDLALYAKWTYPDEVRGEGEKLGYACDKSLVYTITISPNRGDFSTTMKFNSGEWINRIAVEDIPWYACQDGVVWTVSVTAVNTAEGLKYTGKTTQEVRNGELNFTFPIVKRTN
ncbi:MAG: InlB B-repeat-containing protein, partial [Treponema sp.]|nr:InlB B-repeat-containing protein [Treponema sp.]